MCSPCDLYKMLKPRHTCDAKVEAGIDEAGRGCLWGPLVAAAVVWPAEGVWTDEIRVVATQVRDSKKVTAKRRTVLEEAIQRLATAWGIGRVSAAEIDEMGMTWANRMAFQRALEELERRGGLGVERVGRVIIDGVLGLQEQVLGGREQVVEAAGDATYLAVAAASILAKEGRDRMVREACLADEMLDERYGLMRSKGYGTAVHRDAIKKYGMHAEHRRLFLRKLLGLEHTVGGDVDGKAATGYDFLD